MCPGASSVFLSGWGGGGVFELAVGWCRVLRTSLFGGGVWVGGGGLDKSHGRTVSQSGYGDGLLRWAEFWSLRV